METLAATCISSKGQVAIAAGAVIEGTILLWVYDKSKVEPGKRIRVGMKFLLDGLKA